MKIASSRKGSALLIVLGMLAFMVISAVSFSAFMRSSRLPSSYLRRTAAARQLAKAALAEAIERLDVAIGENAYPDQRVGNALPNAQRLTRMRERSARRNYWYNNVFIGGDTFLSPDDTVSTLTLEGLAYIPPPLVNEARRYSRLSHAATWHTLGFDAGRYAYCAIDVSDCLDLNRLVADGRRNSGHRRVTVSHLCENATHTSYDKSPSSWESFMSRFRNKNNEDEEAKKGIIDKSKMPLISLADWNLAVNNGGSSVMTSPFCDYLTGASSGGFYGIGSTSDPKAENIRAMRVVTDSYAPGVSEEQLKSEDLVDLASDEGQPFDSFAANTTLTQIFSKKGDAASEGFKALASRLTLLDMVALYDYLDDNNVPVSLAVPSTERVPMICSVTPGFTSKLKLLGGAPSKVGDDVPGPGGAYVKRTLEYKLDGGAFCSGSLTAEAMFPFRRGSERNETFTYEACLRLFFAPASLSNFRMPLAVIRPTSDNDFKAGGYENGIFKIPLTGPMTTPNFSNVRTEADAVKSLVFAVDGRKVKEYLQNNPVFTIEARFPKNDEGEIATAFDAILSAHCNMQPLDANGQPLAAYSNDQSFLDIVKGDGAEEFTLHAAVFVRVKCTDQDVGEKTVDMVPACVTSDNELNGINNSAYVGDAAFGRRGPLLRFDSAQIVKFTVDVFGSLDAEATYAPGAVICCDPRFNHAPENWIAASAGDTWLGRFGENGTDPDRPANRDGDIFMFNSGQEQLQSIYELAFLPDLSGMSSSGDRILGKYSIKERSAYPTAVGGNDSQDSNCANGSLMWNTYRCYDVTGASRHDFEDIGLVLNDGAFRVNPCSQSIDSLMAAFANTPYDWWAASTNNVDISEGDLDSASAFNKKYAFSAMNSSDKITWDELKQIATKFRDAVRAKNGDWEAAFDSLDWGGDESDFCGVDSSNLSGLTTVDRKFLYGFWHDSFANRQQLFLIFVRAEPTMMGGGSVNQTPPQLGARAVALVWRDPGMEYPSTDASKPHRTRILFYRQFE